MKTVKLSHSILAAWEAKQFEQAIGYYLGQDFPATPAMELGRLKDKQWSAYAERHGRLHPELGGDLAPGAVVQQKYQKIIPFSDDIQILLRGVPDMTQDEGDGIAIIDFKCGMTTASAYVDKWQLDAYKLLLPKATIGYYLCFNPYNNQLSKGVKFLSEKSAENALEHIITTGGEIIDYLQANALLKDYKEF